MLPARLSNGVLIIQNVMPRRKRAKIECEDRVHNMRLYHKLRRREEHQEEEVERCTI